MLYTICKWLFIIFGLIVTLASALPLVRKEAWWIRGFDFPRAQIFFLGLVVLALCPFFLDASLLEGLFLLSLICALVLQAWRIGPYTLIAKKQVLDSARQKPATTLKIMVANVLQSNRRSDLLKQRVAEADPDILLTLECNRWWQKELRLLEKKYPWTIQHPLENTYGMFFYSRLEIIDQQVHFLVEDEVPSFELTLRLPSGDDVRLWCIHPQPPSPTENERSTERDAELVLVGRRVCDLRMPVIVTGDLNDVAWSRTTTIFQRISGLLDPRIGRGRFSTFHAYYPFMRWPLDHIFHSDHFRHSDLRVLPRFGSDHFPILAEVSYEPRKNHQQEEPEAGAEEKTRAEEKVQEAT